MLRTETFISKTKYHYYKRQRYGKMSAHIILCDRGPETLGTKPYRVMEPHSRFCTHELRRKVNKLNAGARHEYRPGVKANYFADDLPLALDSAAL